jgi:hypothetical protein
MSNVRRHRREQVFGIFKKTDKAPPQQSLIVEAAITATSLPEEVSRFLRLRHELNTADLMINVLDEEASARFSSSMQSMSIGKRLGLYVLDDANDSNPYCFITGGIAAGMVVHFNHDPEPRIEFGTLDAFEKFLRALRMENKELGEYPVPSPEHPNQMALAAVLAELSRAEDEDSEFLLCLYLPLLRGEHKGLLQQLGKHGSFFVREAVADAVGAARLPSTQDIIRSLAADPHPQVRAAAIRASKKLENPQRDA